MWDTGKENGNYYLCMQSDHTPGDVSAEETTKRGSSKAGNGCLCPLPTPHVEIPKN